jgi:cyclopropane fatty-acyl-phospholipid synthase-like methyltransferase
MGHFVNRRNAKMNHFAVRQLKLATTDRVLEIGFGGGLTLTHLIENAVFVVGLDRSPLTERCAQGPSNH